MSRDEVQRRREQGNPRWILARRTGREIGRQPVVTALFAVAVIFVIVHTALLSVPEVFPGGARIGEVLFELSVAYIGAWFFNLLVVVLPRRRSRDLVLAEAGKMILRLASVGSALREHLNVSKVNGNWQPIPPLGMLPLDDVSSKVLVPARTPEGPGLRNATWREVVVTDVAQVRVLNASLLPYFQFFEIELIELVNAVVLHEFVLRGNALARMPAGTLELVADPLSGFLDACEELHSYYQREVAVPAQRRKDAPPQSSDDARM